MAQTQAFYEDELLDREVQEAQHLDLGPDAEPDELPVIPCHWSGCEAFGYSCRNRFWEIEPLLLHVNAVHIEAQTNGKFTCEWQGCTRMSKPAGTRSALIAHLRSHTGERPYVCPRPECDKIFARMDALQKHSQSMHAETLPATRKPPTKKRKQDDATSVAAESKREDGEDSAEEGNGLGIEQAPVVAPPDETLVDDERDDEAMAACLSRHPEQLPAFVRYIVTAARHKYAISEHAALVDELDLLRGIEAQMRDEKDRLVEQVTSRVVGKSAGDFFALPPPPDGGLKTWHHQVRTTLGHRQRPQLGKYAEAAMAANV